MATKSKAKKTTTSTVFKSKGSDPDYESYRFYKWFGNQCKFRLQEETDEPSKKALAEFMAFCNGVSKTYAYRLALRQEKEAVDEMKEVTKEIMQAHPEWERVILTDNNRMLPIGVGFFIRQPKEEPEFCEALYR